MLVEYKVVKLYQEGFYLRQIAREVFGTYSIDQVISILKEHPESGYRPNRRRTRRHKYFFDEHFFYRLNTEEKAYYFGFFAADGWIKYNRGVIPTAAGIEILAEDREVLDRLHEILGPQSPPVTVRKAGTNGTDKDKVRLMLHSATMCRDLIARGCGKNKSIDLDELSKYIPATTWKHFVRGYFDGDGSVVIEKYRMRFSFRGTLNFLQNLQQIIPAETKLQLTQKWPSLRTDKHGEAVKLFEWLYNDATIYLKRKREKCESGLAR